MAAPPATLFSVAIFFSSPSRFFGGNPTLRRGDIWGAGNQVEEPQGSSWEGGSFWNLPILTGALPPLLVKTHPKYSTRGLFSGNFGVSREQQLVF